MHAGVRRGQQASIWQANRCCWHLEGIRRQHSAPLLTIRTFPIDTSSSVASLFSIGNLACTGSHIIEGSHAPGRTHCALTCLSSPFLQRTRTTGAPGKKVMTDRHSSSWRICWVYVKAQIWRGRGQGGHTRILGGHHWWDTTGLTCDNVTRFATKHWEASRNQMSTRSPWKMPLKSQTQVTPPLQCLSPPPMKWAGLGHAGAQRGAEQHPADCVVSGFYLEVSVPHT